MKRYLVILLLMLISLCFALPKDDSKGMDKMLNSAFHNAGSLSLETSNWGYTKDLVLSQPNLLLLHKGASWISAKRQRRNAEGELLYWLYPNPSYSHPETVTQDDPLWNPSLKVVLDTLTSVGYDGDDDLYELLPAYNPLSCNNPEVPYNEFNSYDVAIKSILGSPAPRLFAIPDPLGTYCFSYPQETSFDTPGFETISSYLYDYCPFGTPGERDWGINRYSSNHYPLGIAIHRESYAWPIQNFDKMIVFKNIIYNTSAVDTLYDVAICEYTDNDIGPQAYGPEIAVDDVSGYIKGTGCEFAYARDFDGDGGLSLQQIAQKIYIPNTSLNHAAWFWKNGQGPGDRNPRDLMPTARTSNEKYWLATGRNPNASKYTPLRPQQNDIMQWEQPTPIDTRILNSVFGSVPSETDPNPAGRLHLPPLHNLTYYVVYFVGISQAELMNTSQAIENWIDNGFDLGNVSNLTCLPYLYDPLVENPGILQLNWASYSNPDHFEVMYKAYGEPASQWTSISLPGSTRNYILQELDPSVWYHIKVASIYFAGSNEVYLESQIKLLCINNIVENEDPLQSSVKYLVNYPNPFNPATTISYQLPESGKVRLDVYNLKGQLVKTLIDGTQVSGMHSIVWNGTDSQNRKVASGVYLYRLSSLNNVQTKRMLLMK